MKQQQQHTGADAHLKTTDIDIDIDRMNRLSEHGRAWQSRAAITAIAIATATAKQSQLEPTNSSPTLRGRYERQCPYQGQYQCQCQ